MEDFDNNEVEDELKNDDLEEKWDKDEDNYILAKERPLEENRNSDFFLKQSNRFTNINTDFEINQTEESIRNSEIPKNENENQQNSSKENDINKKEEKNKKDRQSRKTRNSDTNIIQIKVILLGDIAVGKSSILSRYVDNAFKEDYKCTISPEYKTKLIDVDLNTAVRMIIWDTIGQERFRNVTRQYYRDSHGAIIVFDLANKDSFDSIPKWIEDLNNNGPENIPILILGNKSDLTLEREINIEDIKKVIGNKYLYYEVSAKNGNNIALAFDKLRSQILEELKHNRKLNNQDENKYNLDKVQSSKCC